MRSQQVIEVGGAIIELDVDEKIAASALRAFAGTTPLDSAVDVLPVPRKPWRLAVAIRGLRWYRCSIGPRLGQRCVFDPSCSRYAELMLRHSGITRSLLPSIHRLWRCRPGAGGVDLPTWSITQEEE